MEMVSKHARLAWIWKIVVCAGWNMRKSSSGVQEEGLVHGLAAETGKNVLQWMV